MHVLSYIYFSEPPKTTTHVLINSDMVRLNMPLPPCFTKSPIVTQKIWSDPGATPDHAYVGQLHARAPNGISRYPERPLMSPKRY